jgi:ABC-type multidrug transport system ATPase subunit
MIIWLKAGGWGGGDGMTMRDSSERAKGSTSAGERGVRIRAETLTRFVRGGTEVLRDVSLVIEPGELVAIVGGSGAGKSTLLEALAGVAPTTSGQVTYDGVDLYTSIDTFRRMLGYVPQDDIIHTELPLERTLRYAARLRLAPVEGQPRVDVAVREALGLLDLTERAGTRVSALSGGQRKRASIAVELLTRPQVFFLDEPTSGLDPATGASLLELLRRLADTEATVVFTTHAMQDLVHCDRVVFLARGGQVAFVGSVEEACAHFGVSSVEEVYAHLGEAPTETWPVGESDAESGRAPGKLQARPLPGPVRQWLVLTARTFESMARSTLTLAILVGSPVMVVAMFAILFQAGAFDIDDPSPTSILMILFWVAFGSFFFGLTYGLLQITTERPILRREHLVGLRLGPYLLSKVTVLLPFLLLVTVLMLGVLRALDRLPEAGLATYGSLTVTLMLSATAALTLGLLASAAVSTSSQAILALPMLCFPAVLFSGAILPVAVMAPVGAAISVVIPVRWAFEAVGVALGVRKLLLRGGSPLGPPLVESYGSAGLETVTTYWAYLAVFIVVFFVATWLVLARTATRSPR